VRDKITHGKLKGLSYVPKKVHGKLFFSRVFSLPGAEIKHTAKVSFLMVSACANSPYSDSAHQSLEDDVSLYDLTVVS
jgi:hypothetical protein